MGTATTQHMATERIVEWRLSAHGVFLTGFRCLQSAVSGGQSPWGKQVSATGSHGRYLLTRAALQSRCTYQQHVQSTLKLVYSVYWLPPLSKALKAPIPRRRASSACVGFAAEYFLAVEHSCRQRPSECTAQKWFATLTPRIQYSNTRQTHAPSRQNLRRPHC